MFWNVEISQINTVIVYAFIFITLYIYEHNFFYPFWINIHSIKNSYTKLLLSLASTDYLHFRYLGQPHFGNMYSKCKNICTDVTMLDDFNINLSPLHQSWHTTISGLNLSQMIKNQLAFNLISAHSLITYRPRKITSIPRRLLQT